METQSIILGRAEAPPSAIDPTRWAVFDWLGIPKGERACWCLAPIEMNWREAEEWARRRYGAALPNEAIVALSSGETLVRWR